MAARAYCRPLARAAGGPPPRAALFRASELGMGVEDAGVERQQPWAAGITQVAQTEQVLDAGEKREVVVLAGDVDGAGLDVLGEQQHADLPASHLRAHGRARRAARARRARRRGLAV